MPGEERNYPVRAKTIKDLAPCSRTAHRRGAGDVSGCSNHVLEEVIRN